MPASSTILARAKDLAAANLVKIVLSIVSVVAFIILWAAVSHYLSVSGSEKAEFLPWPGDVAEALVKSFTDPVPGLEGITMGDLIASSMIRVFWGFLLALFVALPIGLAMGTFRAAETMGRPIVEMFRPIPPLAWVPIFLMVFRSFWGPIGIVFVGVFFPILLNIIFGVKSVDSKLIDAARTLGAKKGTVFTKVVMPTIVPYMMTGIKVGLGVGWMCIVAAEMMPLEGGTGVGYYLWLSAVSINQYEYTYATMIVIGLLGILTTGVAELIEKRVSRWMGMR
jgi:ABC-type nitrate/sulfonate/bicarbonate transport system permease component